MRKRLPESPNWEFTPKVKKRLVKALFQNKLARCIEESDNGLRVRFDAFAINGPYRRVEMLFRGQIVATVPLPPGAELADRYEVILNYPMDGGYLGVKIT